jgi:hypothetical protein
MHGTNAARRSRLTPVYPSVAVIARVIGLAAVTAPGLYLLVLQARTSLVRLRYPMDIEWLEGPLLYQAHRIAHGLGALGAPDDGYLPPFHPPGFPLLLAVIGKVFGESYSMGRSVSLAAFVLATVLAVRAVAQHAGSRQCATAACLLAVGCIASGSPLISGFYDLVRDDMTAMALCVVGATLADVDEARLSRRRIVALALVLNAAVFTRVGSIFFASWIGLFVFCRHPTTGLRLALASLSLAALALVSLQFASKGWFWMYAVAVSQAHPVRTDRFVEGLGHIHRSAPYAVTLPFVALCLAIFRKISRRTVLWLGLLAAALPASLLPFAKRGGFWNDFLPVAFLVGPTAMLVVLDAASALRSERATKVVRWAAFAAVAAVLTWKARQPWAAFDGRRLVPTSVEQAEARTLNARVAALVKQAAPGGAMIAPRAPFLAPAAGDKAQQLSDMPYMDLIWSRWPIPDVGRYIDAIDAKWALLDGTEVWETAAPIAHRYELEGQLAEVPHTLFGDDVGLRFLLRKNDEAGAPGSHVVFDFEQPLDGWARIGDAFDASPTPPNPTWQHAIVESVGNGLVNSYHPTKRDGATGTILSPPFLIDRPRLALRIGGGTGRATRVELRVNGRTVFWQSPIFREKELLVRVVWDVSAFAEKTARLAVVDEDPGPWGHILCDDVVLY